jgi:hypothetical protein
VGKPEGKRPPGRPRHGWEIILRWIFWNWDMDWIELAQDRWRAVVNAVMNLQIPQNAGNFLTS